ncbi:MAG: PAS domain-containing protein [Thalassobaculaceae bacterium]|nr:PAS domain-containing protein [Thalassobaculaceae bacterium]
MAHLRGLHDYWSGKLDGRAYPDRADIDPAEMVPWLPHLLLVETNPAVNDVRFRLIGTWVAARTGRDDSGKTMSQIGINESRAALRDAYLEAARLGQPCRRIGPFHDRTGPQKHLLAERLLLPLSHGGDGVAMILAAIYFIDVRSQSGAAAL